MELSRVQAVLLDMDGTLVDSDAAVERAWQAWAVEYGVDLGDGPPIAHGMPALGNVLRLRPDLTPEQAAAAAGRQLELQYDDVADVTATPGAAELLGELDRLGLPWAIVTSSAGLIRAAARRTRASVGSALVTIAQGRPSRSSSASSSCAPGVAATSPTSAYSSSS